jgi:hypothetical protein
VKSNTDGDGTFDSIDRLGQGPTKYHETTALSQLRGLLLQSRTSRARFKIFIQQLLRNIRVHILLVRS